VVGGGIGEIGRNFMLLQYGTSAIVIDCGVMFPSELEPGVDLILPDLSLLTSLGVRPTHVLLTHGHEDHIGAVPYLLRDFPKVTVVSAKLTLGLLSAKLQEHGIKAELNEVVAGETAVYGDFNVEYLAVAHSVPDGLAVAIEVGGIRLLHTGDFKIDDDPLDGRKTDLAGFERWGSLGVDALLSDSTNADVNREPRLEKELLPIFEDLFQRTSGRIIFACFASNVHRVQQAVDAAVGVGRKVALMGRSMVRNMTIARDLGYLNIPDEALIDFNEAISSEPDRVVLISTGTQGEPLSALARMARHEHKIRPQQGDLVILSARLIPGNEADIFRVVNDLHKVGAEVLHTDNAPIHATGHAPAPDLTRVLQLVRPRSLVPIHGEWRHLRAHASLGSALGMTADAIVLAENGDIIEIDGRSSAVVGSIPFRQVYVDGGTIGTVGKETLQERRRLASDGLYSVAAAVLTDPISLVGVPVVTTRGLPPGHVDSGDIADLVSDALSHSSANPRHDLAALEQAVVRNIRKWLRSQYKIDPFIVASLVSVGGRTDDMSQTQALT
jgi:ribonuclease J